MLIDGVSNIMHNLAVMKTGQGTPQAPERWALEAAEAAQPPSPENNDAAEKNVRGDGPQAVDRSPGAWRTWLPLRRLDHDADVPASDAAGVSVEGTAVYEFLASAGREGIMDILQSSPQVWRDVQRYGNQMEQFLTEFLMVDEARRSAQELLRAAASGPTIVPPPPASASTGPAREKGRVVIGPEAGQYVRLRRCHRPCRR